MSDWLKPDVVLQLVGMFIVALAAYFAIKSDLKVMHEKISASDKRIDTVERDVRHLIFGRERRNDISETKNGG